MDAMTSRSERKHAAIVAAARTVFLRDGFQGANMDAVAAESGVSKQTVYAHFASKENLYVRTVAELTGEIAGGLPSAPAPEMDLAGAQAWLVDYAHRQLSSVLDESVVALRRLVIAEADRFPDVARAFYDNGAARSIELLTTVLADLDSRGLIDVDDPARAASDLNWLVMGEPTHRVMLLGASAAPTRRQLRAHAQHAVATFLAAHQR